MEIPNGWFTTAQAGRRLGVSSRYVRLLMQQGRLRHEATPYGRLVDPAALEQISAQRAARQKGAAAACPPALGSKVDQAQKGL